MNQRILKKQIGVKSTMKIRDYYSARIDEDRPEFLKDMKKYVEAKTGDQIFIISFEPPKLKRKKEEVKDERLRKHTKIAKSD